jgi:hypothetical protein
MLYLDYNTLSLERRDLTVRMHEQTFTTVLVLVPSPYARKQVSADYSEYCTTVVLDSGDVATPGGSGIVAQFGNKVV